RDSARRSRTTRAGVGQNPGWMRACKSRDGQRATCPGHQLCPAVRFAKFCEDDRHNQKTSNRIAGMPATVATLLALAMCAGWTCDLSAAPQAGPRTVWSGVYTAAQAANGKSEYDRSCSRCHASNLDGTPDATIL